MAKCMWARSSQSLQRPLIKYFGSSDELNKDVILLGQDSFKREILRYCKSKSEMSYYEAKYQFDNDVLLNEDKWYNGWISVKVRKFKL